MSTFTYIDAKRRFSSCLLVAIALRFPLFNRLISTQLVSRALVCSFPDRQYAPTTYWHECRETRYMKKRDGSTKTTRQQPHNGDEKLTIDEGVRYTEDADVFSTLKMSLADRVANYLREAIFMGKLAPGEQLREVPLSKMLGISRGPIREALNRLEREGLVTIPRNGRTIVARLTREDFDEVYSLRLGLERVAMQYAIRNATPDELDELQRLVDLMIERVNEGITEKEAADLARAHPSAR